MAGERTRRQVSHPQWSEVRGHLHLTLRDAAVVLNATTKYLRRLCRQNGLTYWPGKKIRSLKAMGIKFTMVVDAERSAWAGLGGHAAEVVETNNMVDDDMIRVHSPVITNHPPYELTTLNLIDKVVLQSSSEPCNSQILHVISAPMEYRCHR